MIVFPMLRMECVTLITNLQIESCLKGYPATVCCTDELPAHVEVRSRTFIVNTDTCDCCGRHWVAFHFPLIRSAEFVDSHRKRTGNVSLPFRQRPRTAILLMFVSSSSLDMQYFFKMLKITYCCMRGYLQKYLHKFHESEIKWNQKFLYYIMYYT
jgi:hypothetical protein